MSDKRCVLPLWSLQILLPGLFLGLMLVLAAGGCAREATDTEPQTVVQQESAAEPPVEPTVEPPTDIARKGPQIEFDSVEFDFGEVVPRAKAVGRYTVKNAGDAPLEIKEVQKCCGASLNWSKKNLQPGESSELEVKYSFVLVGAIKKNLYVASNDPDKPRVTLTFKANVKRKLSWTPSRIKLFLNQENAGAKPIKIKSLDGKPFAIQRFTATGDVMRADVDPNAQATEFTIVPDVNVVKLSQMEIAQGRVQIFHTHPGALTIGLNYDLLPRFAFTPPRLIIFSADPERTEKRKLWMLDNYSMDDADEASAQGTKTAAPAGAQAANLQFEIESVASEMGSVTVTSTSPIKNGYEMLLEITPPEPKPGSRRFEDALLIETKDGKKLSVSVNGYYSSNVRARARAGAR